MRERLGRIVVATVLCCGAVAGAAAANGQTPGDAERMAWWRDAKFGMFIHWGVYAVPAGTYDGKRIDGIGEWIMHRAQIPVARYKQYAREFNPTKYDPESWAQLASDAGMKYMVITSKHHDGFALFDSAVTTWDVADATPYGKDLLAPLAAAARKRGLKFGLYYSQSQDWSHPGGGKANMKEGKGWDDAHVGSYDDYLKTIAVPQTREILTKFQPDVLWWDTPTWMNDERAKPLHDLLALRPGIITNNRLGGSDKGDTETPEQHIPATGFPGRDWETCMTINDTWGFKSYDHNWKSAQTLIRNLVDIVSKGGNYLLNVGPTAEGEIPPESIARLHEIGAWMKVNGEAIYGVQASPCRAPAWGRVARKGDRLFLYVFDWPADGKLMAPVVADVKQATLLGDPARAVTATSTDHGLAVTVEGGAPSPICSVILVDVTGPVEQFIGRIEQKGDGTLTLMADAATLTGDSLQVESIESRKNLGFWTRRDDSAQWQCRLATGGEFEVAIDAAGLEDADLVLQVGPEKLTGRIPATGDLREFKTAALGRVAAPAGEVAIWLRPARGGWGPLSVRSVELRPAK